MAKRSDTYPATIILPIKDNPVWSLERSDEIHYEFGMSAWRAISTSKDGRTVGSGIIRPSQEPVCYGELLGVALERYFNGGTHGEA